MVNMTHNADNRRSLYQVIFRILGIVLQKLFDDIHLNFLLAEYIELYRDIRCGLIIDLLVHGYHLACQEQLFHNYRRLNLHLICQFFDRQNFGDRDHLDLRLFRLLLHRLCRTLKILVGYSLAIRSAQLIAVLLVVAIASLSPGRLGIILASGLLQSQSAEIRIASR